MTTTTTPPPLPMATANNDMCSVCYRDKGKLFWCDSCPKSYHARCVGVMTQTIEKEQLWYCPSCVSDGTARAAMIAAGMLKGEEDSNGKEEASVNSSAKRGGPTLNIKKRRRDEGETTKASKVEEATSDAAESTATKKRSNLSAVSAVVSNAPRLHHQQQQISISCIPYETLFAPTAEGPLSSSLAPQQYQLVEEEKGEEGFFTLGRVLQHLETVSATPEQMHRIRDVLFDFKALEMETGTRASPSSDYLAMLGRLGGIVGGDRLLEAMEGSRGGTAFALCTFEVCMKCNRWKVLRAFCLSCLHMTPDLYPDAFPTRPEQRSRLRAIRKPLPPAMNRTSLSSSSSSTAAPLPPSSSSSASTSTPPLETEASTMGGDAGYERARCEAAERGIEYFAKVCADEKNFAQFGGDMLFLALKLWNTCRVSPLGGGEEEKALPNLVERSEAVFRAMVKKFLETLPERRLSGEEEGMATLLDLAEGIHAVWFLARYDDEANRLIGGGGGEGTNIVESSVTPPLTETTAGTPDPTSLLGNNNSNNNSNAVNSNNNRNGSGEEGEEPETGGRHHHHHPRRAAGQKAMEKIAKRHALNEVFDVGSPRDVMRLCEGVKKEIASSLLRYHVTEWFGFDPHERHGLEELDDDGRGGDQTHGFDEDGRPLARAREYAAPPLTMASHCAHCGHDLNKKGFERCAKCQHVLSRHADFGALTDAAVWAFVFDSMGVKLVGQTRAEVRIADVLSFVRGARASYKDMEYLGFDFWRLQCYFVTHFIYIMSDWGVCNLRRSNFDEEFMLIAQSLPVAVIKQDPELVGEFLHCLRILGFVPTREPLAGKEGSSLSSSSSSSSLTTTIEVEAPLPPSSSTSNDTEDNSTPPPPPPPVSADEETKEVKEEPIEDGGDARTKRKYTKRKGKEGRGSASVTASSSSSSSSSSTSAASSRETFHRVLSRHFFAGIDFLIKHEHSFDKCGGFVNPTTRDVYSKYHAAWTGVVGLISCPPALEASSLSSSSSSPEATGETGGKKTARRPRVMPFTPIELASRSPTFNCSDIRTSYYLE